MIIRDYCKSDKAYVCDLMKNSLGYNVAPDVLADRIEQMQNYSEYKFLVAIQRGFFICYVMILIVRQKL